MFGPPSLHVLRLYDQLPEGSATSVSRKIDRNAPQLGCVLVALRVEDEGEASATNVVPLDSALCDQVKRRNDQSGAPPLVGPHIDVERTIREKHNARLILRIADGSSENPRLARPQLFVRPIHQPTRGLPVPGTHAPSSPKYGLGPVLVVAETHPAPHSCMDSQELAIGANNIDGWSPTGRANTTPRTLGTCRTKPR